MHINTANNIASSTEHKTLLEGWMEPGQWLNPPAVSTVSQNHEEAVGQWTARSFLADFKWARKLAKRYP